MTVVPYAMIGGVAVSSGQAGEAVDVILLEQARAVGCCFTSQS